MVINHSCRYVNKLIMVGYVESQKDFQGTKNKCPRYVMD